MCLACEVYGGIHGLGREARQDQHVSANEGAKTNSAETANEAKPLLPQSETDRKEGAESC